MFLLSTPLRRTVAATAALASVPLLLLAGHQSTATGAADATAFTLRSVSAGFKLIDMPPVAEGQASRPSPGDYVVLRNRLLRGRERVGALHATCVVTSRGARPQVAPLLCTGVYRLRAGTLSGTALLSTESVVNRIAITGGTGRFAGMTGTATEFLGRNDTGTVVFRIQ